MVEKLHDLQKCLMKSLDEEFAKGLENVNTHEAGEVIDMIKDLSEAEYYYTATESMKKDGREMIK